MRRLHGQQQACTPPPPRFLDRLLEQPDLVQRVQALEPGTLARATRHIGLEDAGELVAMASAQQLARIFDEELYVVPSSALAFLRLRTAL